MTRHDSHANDDAATAASARELRLAEALDGYMRELEAGGIPPDVDQWTAAYPELADELREYAESLQLVHRLTAGLRPLKANSRTPAPPADAAAPASARRLGDYQILREIGRGGMGVVYEAQQISLNRTVALKVLPFAAMLDDRQIARFRNEAQAAAQLHHPHIVPVYAVGQERGVHYIAMQYVAGQSLERAMDELRGDPGQTGHSSPSATTLAYGETYHAAERGSSLLEKATRAPASAAEVDTAGPDGQTTRASICSATYCRTAARLIMEAAEALQHAHECGVVHRDVKPSNLLLDAHGKLWVADFGLARIDASAGVTLSGDVLGTLRYMSPEQAAGRAALVDGRADVYGLGATLYELLTLHPVHAGEDRQDVLRRIEHCEPRPPRAINPAIPFDLETIVLRSLAKARDQRYGTAQELADDLRRFLAGQLPIARRPTWLDRAARWVDRRRRAAALLAISLLAISVVSTVAAVRVSRARLQTLVAQQRTEAALAQSQRSLVRAEKDFRQAREVVDRFGGGLARELAELPGSEPLRRKLLAESLTYYREFLGRATNDPVLARDMAATCFKAAMAAESLGQRDDSLALCREAVERFERLAGESPHDHNVALEGAKCRGALGLLLADSGDASLAMDAHRRTIADLERLVAAGGDRAAAVRELARARGNLGLLLGQLGRSTEARAAFTSAIDALAPAVAGAHADDVDRRDLAVCYNNLSYVERSFDVHRAERACRRAIELLEPLAAAAKSSPEVRADLALCYGNLGALLGERRAWTAARQAHGAAIELQRQAVRQAPTVVAHRRDLAASLCNLGQACEAAGSAADALAAFDEAGDIVEQLVDDFPGQAAFNSLYAAVLNNRGMALEALDRTEEAIAAYRAAIGEQRLAMEQAPGIEDYRLRLSKHYFNLGRALRTAGQPELAAAAALSRRELWAGDGEHLGQVAIELAEAIRQLSVGRDAPRHQARRDQLQAELVATLRSAADAGCDVDQLPLPKVISAAGQGSATAAAEDGPPARNGPPL